MEHHPNNSSALSPNSPRLFLDRNRSLTKDPLRSTGTRLGSRDSPSAERNSETRRRQEITRRNIFPGLYSLWVRRPALLSRLALPLRLRSRSLDRRPHLTQLQPPSHPQSPRTLPYEPPFRSHATKRACPRLKTFYSTQLTASCSTRRG